MEDLSPAERYPKLLAYGYLYTIYLVILGISTLINAQIVGWGSVVVFAVSGLLVFLVSNRFVPMIRKIEEQ